MRCTMSPLMKWTSLESLSSFATAIEHLHLRAMLSALANCGRSSSAFAPLPVSISPIRLAREVRSRWGPSLPKEAPRLCRGGSSSLTFTAVVRPKNLAVVSRHTRELECHDGRLQESKPHHEGVHVQCPVVPKNKTDAVWEGEGTTTYHQSSISRPPCERTIQIAPQTRYEAPQRVLAPRA
jgi:hypothetical protein